MLVMVVEMRNGNFLIFAYVRKPLLLSIKLETEIPLKMLSGLTQPDFPSPTEPHYSLQRQFIILML